jgi:archaeosine synthase
MDSAEVRYKLISSLLKSETPLTFHELLEQSDTTKAETLPVLKELISKNLVVEGNLIPDDADTRYYWAARWEKRAEKRTTASIQKLQKAVKPSDGGKLDINHESVLSFHNFVTNEYKPPIDKKFLVFLQCSVRRPFSSSPSHSAMRRAIATATGHDPSPSKDFRSCPVHVVVLASKIGPVPYELEDIYPANVRSGGVKHFDKKYYRRIKPILSNRMAEYITTHKHNYEYITTFTESRYGEIMREASKIAGVKFPILPVSSGAQIMRRGNSIPRTYWDKYWIQLYLEVVSWLDHSAQSEAEKRLMDMDVKYYQV